MCSRGSIKLISDAFREHPYPSESLVDPGSVEIPEDPTLGQYFMKSWLFCDVRRNCPIDDAIRGNVPV